MVDCSNAKELLESIEKQFKYSNNALAGMLMDILTTKKYDRMTSIHKHILEMSNLVKQLNFMDMTIFEPFLV